MPAAWRILDLDTVGSTNDEARRLADAGDAGRVAVVARVQTAGRGRLGRTWASPEGGLYCSALLRPALPVARVGLLPLAAGLALAEVAAALGADVELRWPNDVLAKGRKLAGVLCESRLAPEGGRLDWAVVGMGLNVAPAAPEVVAAGGIGLSDLLGRPVHPASLRVPVLAALEGAVALAERSPEGLVRAWTGRAPMVGRPVRVATAGGSLAGSADGVDPTGALVVRTPEGVRKVTDPDLVRVLP